MPGSCGHDRECRAPTPRPNDGDAFHGIGVRRVQVVNRIGLWPSVFGLSIFGSLGLGFKFFVFGLVLRSEI